jgi:hypothetical protein
MFSCKKYFNGLLDLRKKKNEIGDFQEMRSCFSVTVRVFILFLPAKPVLSQFIPLNTYLPTLYFATLLLMLSKLCWLISRKIGIS